MKLSDDAKPILTVRGGFCGRHPIPDYYSITLEISRARTTSVRHVICNSRDPSKPRCPQRHRDGDTYVYRTPNVACVKLVCSLICLL